MVSIPCPWQHYSLKPSKESGTRQINKWLNWIARSAGKYSEPKQHLPSKLKFDTGHNFKMREMRFFKLSSSVLYQQGHNDIRGHTKTVKLCPPSSLLNPYPHITGSPEVGWCNIFSNTKHCVRLKCPDERVC